MPRLIIRCYAELNDFLDRSCRQVDFAIDVPPGTTVGDAAIRLGIPAERIDLALVNGTSVSLSAELVDGMRVSLFPVFESFNISSASAVSGTPLRIPRFVVDSSLFKLGRHLRMLGFDAESDSSLYGKKLIDVSLEQQRTVLCRSQLIGSNPRLTHVFRIRTDHPRDQLVEVLIRFELLGMIKPFTRCLCCNQPVRPIDKADVEPLLPAHTKNCFDDFRICRHCRKIYWEGGHHQRMSLFIEEVQQRIRDEASKC